MNIIRPLLLFCTGLTLSAMPAYADSVRDVSASTSAPASMLPHSFETDTKKMLEDWYLQNYAVLDYDTDGHRHDNVSDDVIIERLSRLPAIIEMPLNVPVRNAINFYALRKPQLVENMLGLSLYYMPIFRDALERYGMPLELQYLPVIESALVPTAESRAGAAGLWQFMPGTGSDMGLEINSLIDQRRDPYLSSDAAARYLKNLYNIFGDWSLAIAAYNCGPGNVNKAIRRAGDGKHDFWEIYPFLPAETRGYVPAFIAANYIMNYHKDHNISPALARRPLVVDTVHVSRRVHFEQISEVMDIPITELRALNPQFRQDIIPGDIRPYTLVLPSLQALAYIVNEDSIVNHNAAKYARRGRVEPASGQTVGRDENGEYYDEDVVRYHTVRRGETLSSIARKYGVSVAQIRKYNKVGKSAKRGAKLKIVTTRRRYKPAPAPQPADTMATAPQPEAAAADTVSAYKPVLASDSIASDSIAVAEAPSETETVTAAFAAQPAGNNDSSQTKTAAKSEKKSKKQSAAKAAPAKQQATTHTVRRGENLGKIARRYGVTIAQIKRANNMAGDRIQAGQKLKIPAK